MTENNCSETVTVEVGVVDLQFSMSLSTYSALASAEVTIEGVVRNRTRAGGRAHNDLSGPVPEELGQLGDRRQRRRDTDCHARAVA